jgi:hypothetical protein
VRITQDDKSPAVTAEAIVTPDDTQAVVMPSPAHAVSGALVPAGRPASTFRWGLRLCECDVALLRAAGWLRASPGADPQHA